MKLDGLAGEKLEEEKKKWKESQDIKFR